MKQLKEYIKEGLFDDIDKLEGKNSFASNTKQLKKEIVDWVSNNYYSSYTRKSQYKLKKRTIEVDTTTTPPTVNYNYDLYASDDITSLNNNGLFQWGKVDGSFSCSKSKSFTTLEGAPEKVGRDFSCFGCTSLKTLEGCPKEVGGNLECCDCSSLESLKGAPEKLRGSFNCSYCNSLVTLEGAPKEVGWDFLCLSCELLKSLEGAPKEVGKDFSCSSCQLLKTLEGAPKVVGGNFYCYSCGGQFTEDDVKKVSKVKKEINIG